MYFCLVSFFKTLYSCILIFFLLKVKDNVLVTRYLATESQNWIRLGDSNKWYWGIVVIVFKLSSDTSCVLIYKSNNEEFYLPWMIQLILLHVILINWNSNWTCKLQHYPFPIYPLYINSTIFDLPWFLWPYMICWFIQLSTLLFSFLNFEWGYCFEHLDICTYDVEYSLFDFWVNDD